MRALVVVLAVLAVAGCGAPGVDRSGEPASPASPSSTTEVRGRSEAPTGAPTVASGRYVLFTFSNSESGDRSLDLVALDLVTGELLLAPWGRAEGWFADGAAWWPTGDALIISRYARREDPESAFWTRVPVDPAEPVIPLAAGPIRGEPVPSPDGAWTGIYGWGDAAQAAFVRSDGSGDPVFGPRGQIVWSPDGRRAAILSDDYRLAVFDTVARKVTDLAAEAWPLSSLSGQPAVVWPAACVQSMSKRACPAPSSMSQRCVSTRSSAGGRAGCWRSSRETWATGWRSSTRTVRSFGHSST